MKYEVVECGSIEGFVIDVQKLLDKGWVLFGGLNVNYSERAGKKYTQALVKYENPIELETESYAV